jgi:hypothetical protein
LAQTRPVIVRQAEGLGHGRIDLEALAASLGIEVVFAPSKDAPIEGIGQVAPGVLFLELLEAGLESRPLPTRHRDLWDLEPTTELTSSRVDDRAGQRGCGNGRQDLEFHIVGRAAPGTAGDVRAPVVAPFAATLDMPLAAHPSAANADHQAAQDLVPIR